MMFKFVVLAICLLVVVQQAAADTCSYNHCYKEELAACKSVDKRENCSSLGQIYVTYREGAFSLSK